MLSKTHKLGRVRKRRTNNNSCCCCIELHRKEGGQPWVGRWVVTHAVSNSGLGQKQVQRSNYHHVSKREKGGRWVTRING